MGDDSHHGPEYYAELKKKINAVGWILIIGTVLTFIADLFDIAYYLGGFGWAILIAMFVALIKATGVVAVFMHLWWDAKYRTISITMICTFIFFAGMMGLTVAGERLDKPGMGEGFDEQTGLPAQVAEDDAGAEKDKKDE